jgi:hypothetical protein
MIAFACTWDLTKIDQWIGQMRRRKNTRTAQLNETTATTICDKHVDTALKILAVEYSEDAATYTDALR